MKKSFFRITIILLIFLISIVIGKLNYEKIIVESKFDNSNGNTEEIKVMSNVIEKNEFFSLELFEPTYDNDSNDEIYLYKDMTLDSDSNLYYKIILSIDDYERYKARIPLMDMEEKDFEDKFIIVLSNENNNREYYEKDLIIYDVLSEEKITKIIVKQRENPSYYSKNNVLVAVVNKSILNDEIDIKIDN